MSKKETQREYDHERRTQQIPDADYFSQSTIDRFWKKVDIRNEDECWLWNAGKTNDGYGIFAISYTAKPAHRYVKEIEVRQRIPRELDSSHLCQERACCNPAHLVIESRTKNMARGANVKRTFKRSKVVVGELARQIWNERPEFVVYGDHTEIGRKYGVTRHVVKRIWEKGIG